MKVKESTGDEIIGYIRYEYTAPCKHLCSLRNGNAANGYKEESRVSYSKL